MPSSVSLVDGAEATMPPSNNQMNRDWTPPGPGWVYREKKETFSDCVWHLIPDCFMSCGVLMDTMRAKAAEANGTLLMSEKEAKRYLEEHPEKKAEGFGFWCLKCGCCRYCLCSLPSVCGTCAYCWCVFIPCGRFCPGRCACLPSCCPGKSCKAMDSMLLAQESIGPGWVSPMRERFKDEEEEEEEERAQ